MPVLRQIRERFANEKPLKGLRIAACLHVTTETANLLLTLQDGGAEPPSRQQSTQHAGRRCRGARHEYGIPTFAIKGEDSETYYSHINSALDFKPHITMDDGADLVATLHSDRTVALGGLIGGTEETTTGVIRLRSLAEEGRLRYPIIAVNDADTKHFFDTATERARAPLTASPAPQHPVGRQECRRRRLRLVRTRRCPPRSRHGRANDCDRGQPHTRA